MDAYLDPQVEEIVFMKASRIGGTMAVLNILGRSMDVDPGPALWVWPDIDNGGKRFSELELSPMIRDTPSLATKLDTQITRDSRNKILRKIYPGGVLYIAGSNSAAGLAQITVRDVFMSEVDRFTRRIIGEGDPVQLAKNRKTTFKNSKVVMESSPTITGKSKIAKAYLESDQRVFEIPCPACGTRQELKFGQLKWDDLDSPAYYVCEACAYCIEHSEKERLVAAGQWRATQPFRGIAGFRLNALVSRWRTWNQFRDEFTRCRKDPEELQVFVNTWLAETWDPEQIEVAIEDLQARQDVYSGECPDGILCIVAGVDVQHDRIEIAVLGFGLDGETWWLDYWIIWGDPLQKEVWLEVEKRLLTTYQATHKELKIEAAFIDSGDGNRSDEVYKFTKSQNRKKRKWFSCKGSKALDAPILARPRLQGRAKTINFMVGVNTIKDTIAGQLAITKPGPLYVHFPKWDAGRYVNFTDELFKQIRSEQPEEEFLKGKKYFRWKKIRKRNEALDCWTYCKAALAYANPDFARRDRERLEILRTQITEDQGDVPQPAPARQETKHKRQRKLGFVQGWKSR